MDNVRLSPLVELKRAAISDAGVFEGLASTFGGAPDSYGDVIQKGSFVDSLVEHKRAGTMPAMLWAHEQAAPIGRWLDIRETDLGLLVRGKLTLGTQLGSEARALMQDGALAMSIGYRAKEFAVGMRPGEPRRTLKKVELVEISAVALPANPSAKITSVKSASTMITRPQLERTLRDAGLPQRLVKSVLDRGWDAAAKPSDSDTAETLAAIKATRQRLEAMLNTINERK